MGKRNFIERRPKRRNKGVRRQGRKVDFHAQTAVPLTTTHLYYNIKDCEPHYRVEGFLFLTKSKKQRKGVNFFIHLVMIYYKRY